MKARIMIESAALGPAAIRTASQAFDAAWSEIAYRYTTPTIVDDARQRLASIVLSLMPDTKDPAEIQAIAVQEMTKGD